MCVLLRNLDFKCTSPPLVLSLFPVLLMAPVFIQGNISQCQANFSEPYR